MHVDAVGNQLLLEAEQRLAERAQDVHFCRARLVAVNKVFSAVDQQAAGSWGSFGAAARPSDQPFVSPVKNFYMTCPISRASRTMAECTASRAQLMAAE